MSDRQLFDRSSAIPRGRYEARVLLDRTPTGNGPMARGMGNPTPLARFGRGGFEATQGGDALRSAKAMGMKSAPVAMTMTGWRKAAAAGMIASGPSVQNLARKAEISRFGGMTTVSIVVDLHDFERLGRSFEGMAVALTRGHVIVAQAINEGMRGLKTGLRRKLKAWTGIRSYAETAKGMTITRATPQTMTGVLRLSDRHRRIGKNFGAAWSPSNPGGTHAAWNRPQMAAHSFMAKGILFKREGKGRLPIAPLWGPNMAREVERHREEVQRDVVVITQQRVQAAAVRLLRAAIAKGR